MTVQSILISAVGQWYMQVTVMVLLLLAMCKLIIATNPCVYVYACRDHSIYFNSSLAYLFRNYFLD